MLYEKGIPNYTNDFSSEYIKNAEKSAEDILNEKEYNETEYEKLKNIILMSNRLSLITY